MLALANTDRFYTLRDVATKVLPSLCSACVDPEKDVRDEAFKTIKFFMQKLEKVSENPEQALEMEKDVTSCALELKNETSWTSWAMTGLSAKMTGYKNKNQQPSVALNTQPLGPPPSLVIPSTGTSSEKPSPNKTQSSVSPQSKPQQNQESSNSNNKISNSAKTKTEETNIGWNLDDEEWKDLDDDGEQMEPLEVNSAMSYLSQPSKNNETKSSSNSNNNDWSSWTNSFEDEKNTQLSDIEKSASSKNKPNNSSNNTQSHLPLASSYNWSIDSNTKNEEDLFSSLVKDVKISNNNNKKTNATSDWSSGWDEFEENSQKTGTAKKQERHQRNTDKQAENENKMKQSKPLKLGQKKDPIF